MRSSPKVLKNLVRRRLRFGLRGLLLGITCVGLWLGYYTHHARQQRELVAWVNETGGFVQYRWQLNKSGSLDPNAVHPLPQWFRELAGDDFLQEVHVIAVGDPALTDLSPLSTAKHLRELFVGSEKVNDLRPLAHLRCLRRLRLSVSNLGDLKPLHRLTHLEELSIRYGGADTSDIDSLRSALPNCRIIFNYAGNRVPPVAQEAEEDIQNAPGTSPTMASPGS